MDPESVDLTTKLYIISRLSTDSLGPPLYMRDLLPNFPSMVSLLRSVKTSSFRSLKLLENHLILTTICLESET